MGMTHYMELMMGSWYLLVLFMALPMFLAECYVVSEILLLLEPNRSAGLKTFNRWSAYASAVVIAALAAYAAVYFSRVTEWRTWVDVTAAVSYVAAGLPFIYVGLLEAGFVGRTLTAVSKGRRAVAAVVLYLILAHAAMVFGMFDPMQFGWKGTGHMMHDMSSMPMTDQGTMDHMHHAMGHSMPEDAKNNGNGAHHCGGMMDDFSGMTLPEGHPVPEGYHRMPDGQLMKNNAMTMPGNTGHHCE